MIFPKLIFFGLATVATGSSALIAKNYFSEKSKSSEESSSDSQLGSENICEEADKEGKNKCEQESSPEGCIESAISGEGR